MTPAIKAKEQARLETELTYAQAMHPGLLARGLVRDGVGFWVLRHHAAVPGPVHWEPEDIILGETFTEALDRLALLSRRLP